LAPLVFFVGVVRTKEGEQEIEDGKSYRELRAVEMLRVRCDVIASKQVT